MKQIEELFYQTGFFALEWRMIVMWLVAAALLYLAVFKKFEPLLLVPIAFGALLANLPTQNMVNPPAGPILSPVDGTVIVSTVELGQTITMPPVAHEMPKLLGSIKDKEDARALLLDQFAKAEEDGQTLLFVIRPKREQAFAVKPDYTEIEVTLNSTPVAIRSTDQLVWANASGSIAELQWRQGEEVVAGAQLAQVHSPHTGGFFHYISLGIILELFPPLIFLGVGALTDFGPLIANPRTLLLGAAAQFGVFATYAGAMGMGIFNSSQAAAIGIIGGADGPTSIFLANSLAPELLAPIAVAAYSYMALVPVIQPPIMKALTSKDERKIRMKSLRKVSRLEKLIFALVVVVFCILLVPAASPLIGLLLLGNFLRECGVTERLSKAAQNELINVITIFLGTSVGITMTGDRFLKTETLAILALGIVAFGIATASGVLMAKFMNLFSKNKINPLIGSAGVSAVPMAARVSQVEGQKADSGNFLLMHAMGPNVAGVIGTALVAGYFMTVMGGGH
ncbi:sodium ion-translocating decarboxylase subunit beta [Pelagicoccus sp. SDUM812005]|uniref:sodium ion-translocating decarboxylase subunit beta n=1 Tax=Pelagicoccus sp. SDUM812005 TaxID=3041257 RepID=UPI00280EC895|nr:sodium ion-translocating decarboxylase subunit beta [Pelagicoccus sp. SDUM812005]MDQ8180107.1 sodium ion-translocating decarboxylase subunit beta [Pelagicoccus sp. SDUM812005]